MDRRCRPFFTSALAFSEAVTVLLSGCSVDGRELSGESERNEEGSTKFLSADPVPPPFPPLWCICNFIRFAPDACWFLYLIRHTGRERGFSSRFLDKRPLLSRPWPEPSASFRSSRKSVPSNVLSCPASRSSQIYSRARIGDLYALIQRAPLLFLQHTLD